MGIMNLLEAVRSTNPYSLRYGSEIDSNADQKFTAPIYYGSNYSVSALDSPTLYVTANNKLVEGSYSVFFIFNVEGSDFEMELLSGVDFSIKISNRQASILGQSDDDFVTTGELSSGVKAISIVVTENAASLYCDNHSISLERKVDSAPILGGSEMLSIDTSIQIDTIAEYNRELSFKEHTQMFSSIGKPENKKIDGLIRVGKNVRSESIGVAQTFNGNGYLFNIEQYLDIDDDFSGTIPFLLDFYVPSGDRLNVSNGENKVESGRFYSVDVQNGAVVDPLFTYTATDLYVESVTLYVPEFKGGVYSNGIHTLEFGGYYLLIDDSIDPIIQGYRSTIASAEMATLSRLSEDEIGNISEPYSGVNERFFHVFNTELFGAEDLALVDQGDSQTKNVKINSDIDRNASNYSESEVFGNIAIEESLDRSAISNLDSVSVDVNLNGKSFICAGDQYSDTSFIYEPQSDITIDVQEFTVESLPPSIVSGSWNIVKSG